MVAASAQGWMETYCGDPKHGGDSSATIYTKVPGKVRHGGGDCDYTEIRRNVDASQPPEEIDATCYGSGSTLRRQCNFAWKVAAGGGEESFDIQEYEGDNPTVQTEVFRVPTAVKPVHHDGVAASAQALMDAHCSKKP